MCIRDRLLTVAAYVPQVEKQTPTAEKPDSFFTSKLELTAFLKRSDSFSVGRVTDMKRDKNEFEQRDQRRALALALENAKEPEGGQIRVPAQITLGKYNFEESGFPISGHFFDARRIPSDDILNSNAAPDISFRNMQGNLILKVPEDKARNIAGGGGRRFNAVIEANVVDVEVPEGTHFLAKDALRSSSRTGISAKLVANFTKIVVLDSSSSKLDYRGEEQRILVQVEAP